MGKKTDSGVYVLYGFLRDNHDSVGYWKAVNQIVLEQSEATRFPAKSYGRKKKKGFGTPQQWLEFISEEMPEWKFHLVKVLY